MMQHQEAEVVARVAEAAPPAEPAAADPEKAVAETAFRSALIHALSPAGPRNESGDTASSEPPADQSHTTVTNPSFGCSEESPDMELGAAPAPPPPPAIKSSWSRLSATRIACGRRQRCTIGCSLFAALVLALVIFLRPKDPDWRLTALNIDVAKFGAVMMGGANTTEPLTFSADARFHNPNWIGSTMEPGHFKVFFQDEVMAEGTTSEGHVGARSSADVSALVTMKLSDGMSKKIMDELTANDFKLNVIAEVETPAKALFATVIAKVRCEILSDAMQVMQTPENVIIEKSCTYKYTL